MAGEEADGRMGRTREAIREGREDGGCGIMREGRRDREEDGEYGMVGRRKYED